MSNFIQDNQVHCAQSDLKQRWISVEFSYVHHLSHTFLCNLLLLVLLLYHILCSGLVPPSPTELDAVFPFIIIIDENSIAQIRTVLINYNCASVPRGELGIMRYLQQMSSLPNPQLLYSIVQSFTMFRSKVCVKIEWWWWCQCVMQQFTIALGLQVSLFHYLSWYSRFPSIAHYSIFLYSIVCIFPSYVPNNSYVKLF